VLINREFEASRFRERQTAGSNFLGKIFVERFRFIFFFLRRKDNYVFQFKNSKFTYSLLPDKFTYSLQILQNLEFTDAKVSNIFSVFSVDDCDRCDIRAICVKGKCLCRVGYSGNGYQCTKSKLTICCFHAVLIDLYSCIPWHHAP
jgi:hypothetical protein